MEQFNNGSGFTLIELLVTIAILGVLLSGALVALDIGNILGRANIAKAKGFASSVQSGLVANQVGKWSFDNESFPGVDTSPSGYGNNGTVSGADFQNEDLCGLKLGGCLKFDDVGDKVEVPDSPSLDIVGSPITMSAWIKASVASGTFGIVNKSSGTDGYGMTLVNDKIKLGHDSTNFITSNTTIKIEKWYHILGIINGSDSKIYINGVLDVSGNVTTTLSTSSPLLIGDKFKGLIDEVAIYDKAFLLSLITPPPPTPP